MSESEVLVIGAGPAGLAAAIAAARSGANVTLVDEGLEPGGQLRYRRRAVQPAPSEQAVAARELADRLAESARSEKVHMLMGTTVWGAFGDGSFGASRGDEPMLLTPAVTVLATGSTDLPLIFPGGSLAGVFNGRAALILANAWGVLPGARWAIVGRSRLPEIEDSIVAAGGEVVAHAGVDSALRAFGTPLLEAIEIDGAKHAVDCVAICAGRQPEASLAMMCDVPFGYATALGGYVPIVDKACRTALPNLLACGDAAGSCSPEIALAEGAIAGAAAAVEAGAADPESLAREIERFGAMLAARRDARAAIRADYVQPVR